MPSKYIRTKSDYRNSPHTGVKNPPTGTDADLNLATLLPILTNEDKAREFMEAKRWPNGPVCPHCQSTEAYRLTAKPDSKSPVRPGVCKCKKCRKQFTVRVGTIFEDSKLPIHKWLMAIHLMCAAKNGISSHELARQLDITQKSAWFVCHRIREAMKLEPMAGMLSGTVEVDEAYIGGKPRYKGVSKRGRGTSKKPVMVLVERDGKAVSFPIASPNADTLKGAINHLCHKSSTIMTDELPSYRGVGEGFDGRHHAIKHNSKEYVRREKCGDVLVSTNTAESFFARIKRAHYGTHHQLSAKHLHRYMSEFSFRWNTRTESDGERFVSAIKGAEGKRLMFREPKE